MKQFNNRKSPKGFTLVELLLYMGILTIFISILTSIFVSAVDVKLESEATSSVSKDELYILAKLAYDMQRASSILIPLSLGEERGSLKLVIAGVEYTCAIDVNENLTLTNGAETDILNSYGSKISNFLVKRLGNIGKTEDMISVGFTITSRTKKISGSGSQNETRNAAVNLSLRRK